MVRTDLRRSRIVLAILLVLGGIAGHATAGGVFGPNQYQRTAGPPNVFEDSFVVENPTAPVYLRVRNGEPNGQNRVSSIVVELNGIVLVDEDDIDETVPDVLVLANEALNQQAGGVNAIRVILDGALLGYVEVAASSQFDAGMPPPAPIVGTSSALVSTATVTVSGVANGAVELEIVGNDHAPVMWPVIVPLSGPAFVAEVPLAPNANNAIAFTSISASGVRSASTVIHVTRDNSPPTLFVDGPAEGREVTTPSIDVVGRVGDTLSGFMGLDVTVTNTTTGAVVAAIVDVGIGSNGTYLASQVPLAQGANQLQVVATDLLGNETVRQRMVAYAPVPPDVPQMSIASGNNQEAPAQSLLAQPIVVAVQNQNGQPLVNKLLTFKVTRSNGRLSDAVDGTYAMVAQARTNGQGLATAFWRLGNDAGCGNNRVEVTANDIAGTVLFCASASSAAPTTILVGTGNNQRVETSAPAPTALAAWVTDGTNPVGGVPVTFTVVRGGGKVAGMNQTTVVTNATGRAPVFFRTGSQPGNNVVEATFAGNPGLPARFTITGIRRDMEQPTTFEGLVLDNASRPIGGATAILEIAGDVIATAPTDEEGRFFLTDIETTGLGHLRVDPAGATTLAGGPIPPGVIFPKLAYEVTVIANTANTLPTPVLLPPLSVCNIFDYDPQATEDTILTVNTENPAAPGDCVPLIDGLKFRVLAGTTVTLADGTVFSPSMPGVVQLELNPVHVDDIPMPFPDGAAPPFAWTLQPGGATFDPPIQIEMPNMVGLPPGAAMFFLSFNHATNRFEIVSSGRVTDDGSCMMSDEGSGISTAGWGGICPPYPPTGDTEDEGDDDDDDESDEDQEDPNKSQGEGAAEGLEGGSAGPQCDDAGDPVYPFSGEFYEDVEDLRIKGRGMDFVWSRKYRSKLGPNTAQGNGWDYSYNVFVFEDTDDEDLVVCDGRGRLDTYKLQSDGTYERRGYFRSLEEMDDGSGDPPALQMRFSSQGTWGLHPIDGSPMSGRIETITDRNGNTIELVHDDQGRLVKVIDTLDREILIDYDADGYISTVTDFIGRQVRYEYYQDGDAGGSAGDLKSVTTPAVVGTPNGNDFPNGKTTTYTYSKGFADDNLNHNLLTITDAKGQTYLTNVYAATTDPDDVNYDRVMRQVWGDAGDILDFVYVPQNDGDARMKTILNDRNGNVSEFLYDEFNRIIASTVFTGRANPDEPTTETTNRPVNPLRDDDPERFTTRFQWNDESLLSRTIHPNGNTVVNIYDADLDDDCPQRVKGNLRRRIHRNRAIDRPASTPPFLIADQDEIVEQFFYDTDFQGGCCGFNFVSKHIDGRGNATEHEYDDRGNRIMTIHRIDTIIETWEYNEFGQMTAHVLPDNGSGHNRRDEYTYYTSGPQRGYMKDAIVDATGFALTTTYEYDAVGNAVKVFDPKGNDTRFLYNALDQVVQETTRDVNFESPEPELRYRTLTWYDANDNVVRIDRENVDENGDHYPNAWLTTLKDYETLNEVVAYGRERGEADLLDSVTSVAQLTPEERAEFVVEEFEYDAKRNQTLVRYGEATNGNQPLNTLTRRFDERDLLFQETRAEGYDIPETPWLDSSTTQYDYDRNQNPKRTTVGLEHPEPQEMIYRFDGFNRLTGTLDPMRNLKTFAYDSNGNMVERVVRGQFVDEPGVGDFPCSFAPNNEIAPWDCDSGNSDNVLLARSQSVYDELNRPVEVSRSHFETWAQTPLAGGDIVMPIGDGLAIVTRGWSDLSQLLVETDDRGHSTLFEYDTAGRLREEIDPAGNRRIMAHDANSNTVIIESFEVTSGSETEEVFRTVLRFDGHDRRRVLEDSVGNSRSFFHDSRNNRVLSIDAIGNAIVHAYDGLDRSVESRRVLTDSGAGGGAIVGAVVTRNSWDDSSRLVGQIDPNGNETKYIIDPLDREIAAEFADGTSCAWVLDPRGNRAEYLDANGTHVQSSFDLADRLVAVAVNVGVGVSDQTTFENYEYDGLSRVVRAEDDDSLVLREYDSHSNLTVEDQGGHQVRAVYDGVGNRVSIWYPSGRHVTSTFDELDRPLEVADADGWIVRDEYVGPSRLHRRAYANGTEALYEYNGQVGVTPVPGDAGVKRVTRVLHQVAANADIIDERSYIWDAMYNKLVRSDERAGIVQTFAYDSIYRLVRSAASASSEMAVVSPERSLLMTDTLEAVGSKAAPLGGRIQAADPAGASVLEYLYDDAGNRTKVVGGPSAGPYVLDETEPEPADLQMNQYTETPFGVQTYDQNGNLMAVSGAGQVFGYDFRNRLVRVQAPGSDSSFAYDVFGRRISSNNDGVVQTYVYGGASAWQVLEQLGEDSMTFVFGARLDEILAANEGLDRMYVHADELGSVVATTDVFGEVLARAEYVDFGGVAGGPDGLPYGFAGRRFDGATQLYYSRTRYLDPRTGQFISADTKGIWRDNRAMGNARVYAAWSPWTLVDPTGCDAIGIVFEDYPISVPSWIPFAPDTTTDPGHAGVALIDENGNVSYYEYGRYDKEKLGLTLKRPDIPGVELGPDGKPTPDSLKNLMEYLQKEYGKGSPIDGAYCESDQYEAMKKLADDWVKRNKDPNRDPYDHRRKHCGTFMRDVIAQDPTLRVPETSTGSFPTGEGNWPVDIMKNWKGRGVCSGFRHP